MEFREWVILKAVKESFRSVKGDTTEEASERNVILNRYATLPLSMEDLKK